MEYGKLLAVLLSTAVSERPDSVDQRIAQYIMDHLGDAGAITMRRIEQSCHVGNASISRFCRRIGLRDFFELRELVAAVRFQADADAADTFAGRMAAHRDDILESLDQVVASLSEAGVRALCADIHRYRRVAVFGILKSEAAALVLQSEMAALGKNLFTVVSHVQQREWLRTAGADDLVILLSYRGIYLDYLPEEDPAQGLAAPRVWLITGATDPPPAGVDAVLRFDTDFDQRRHPHQMAFVCDTLVREYARMYGLPEAKTPQP